MANPGTGPWRWDPTLYAGSAAYYTAGRVAYPPDLTDLLVDELHLDGRGRLIDIGCGPGSLTLLLAPHVERVIGVDADADMLAEARRRADSAGVRNAGWMHRMAEEIPVGLGPFRAATMAQSFHWMDGSRVAGLLARLLEPAGEVAYVHATTHRGLDGERPLPHPRPPRRQMDELVESYLGPGRRAGRGYRPADRRDEQERQRGDAAVFAGAGMTGPVRRLVPGRVVDRSADDVVASVFSLSYAAPHLFGGRAGRFERDLRDLLARTGPSGRFSEEMREIAVDIWRR